MATITIYGKNNQILYQGSGVRMSGPYDRNGKWMGKVFIWPAGPHRQGAKPIATINMDDVRTKKSSGRKGIYVSK